jgi:hypothetical protein
LKDLLHARAIEESACPNAKGKRHSSEAIPRFVKGVGLMSNQRFPSGWDAIEDTPQEAENMKLRSALMAALKDHIAQTIMS